MKIFRAAWNIWFWFWMFCMLVPYIPFLLLVMLIGNRSLTHFFLSTSYYWVPRILFWGCLIRMKRINESSFDPKNSYVIVSNHQSALDIYASAYLSPVHFKYLSKEEVRKMPVFGFFTSFYCVFVDRKSRESRLKSFQAMSDLMAKGENILVYPEGTRNRTNQPLTEFYDGAFKLAVQAQRPVLVEVLSNTGKLNSPKAKLDLRPGVINGYLLGPIETKGMTDEDIPHLKEKVKELMLQKLSA